MAKKTKSKKSSVQVQKSAARQKAGGKKSTHKSVTKKKLITKKTTTQKNVSKKKKVVVAKGKGIGIQKLKKKVSPKSHTPTKEVSQSDKAAKSFGAHLKQLKIWPLGDRVVVELVSKETITPGGLIVPDTVSGFEGYHKGRVLAVGQGQWDKKGRIHPLELKAGDEVLFPRWAGETFSYQGQTFVILRESDVLGVAEK